VSRNSLLNVQVRYERPNGLQAIQEFSFIRHTDVKKTFLGASARSSQNWRMMMQEKQVPVFIVATANDVSQLPPEMLRKGRWDELFFVDLPSQARSDLADSDRKVRARSEGLRTRAVGPGQ
jgi:hypothetical protein